MFRGQTDTGTEQAGQISGEVQAREHRWASLRCELGLDSPESDITSAPWSGQSVGPSEPLDPWKPKSSSPVY